MADVTVNINGDASGLKRELDSVRDTGTSGSHPSGSSGSVPSNSRMVEDVRREMQQRGVLLVPGSSSMSQLINQYGQAQKDEANSRVQEKYSGRREALERRASEGYSLVEKEAEAKRAELEKFYGSRASDPINQAQIERSVEAVKEFGYKRVGLEIDKEEENINKEQSEETAAVEKELTEAIKQLTSHFNREAQQNGDGVGYIGRLRADQRRLLQVRDTAETKEEAQAASEKLAETNLKIQEAMKTGGTTQGRPYYDSMLQGSQGLMGMFQGLQGGDIGSTIMGGGSAIAGLSGMSMKAALRFLGWVGVAAGAGKFFTGTSDTYESMSELAALRSPSGGLTGERSSEYVGGVIPTQTFQGRDIADFGYGAEEFGGEAARRIKARGMADNWFDETLRSIGLERNLALEQGSLMKGSEYDKYGINVTDALSRMVTILSGIEGSGVSNEDFTRVQEKYDIQQQIMGSWMGRSDRPNYDSANNMLAAFSSVSGITQDSRLGDDIQQFQSMIQNPMNERMKTLIYSSVADLFPSTGGRMDLIDRELRDPENEGKIIQAVVKRVESMFGGTDTQMGYFAFKNLLPGIAPDRLDEFIREISDGGAGRLMKDGIVNIDAIRNFADGNVDGLAAGSTEFQTAWTKGSQGIINAINYWGGKMIGLTPSSNLTKSGGNQ